MYGKREEKLNTVEEKQTYICILMRWGGGGGGYITESFEDRRICLHLFSFDAIKLEFSLYK